MTVSATTITGSIYLPNISAPQNGKIVFELSSWDQEMGEAVFVTGPYMEDIDGSGNFSVDLFTSGEGENGVVYNVYVQYLSQAGYYKNEFLGTISLAGPGPFDLSNLAFIDPMTTRSFDLLAEVQGMKDSIETDIAGVSIDIGALATAVTNAEGFADDASGFADDAAASAASITVDYEVGDPTVTPALDDLVVLQDASNANAASKGLASGIGAGRQTIWIPAAGLTPAITNGPEFTNIETGSLGINYGVLGFDATVDESCFFNLSFPKSWDLGTISYQVFWTTEATDTDGVAWALEGLCRADDAAIDTGAFGTAIVVTDDNIGAAFDLLVTPESSALTVANAAADTLALFRLFRDVSDGNNDMAEDANLIGIKIFYNTVANTDN